MTPLLEARGIVKRYGHVTALSGADFTVNPGEVVALIGDNGAGKSTLVKVLSGVISHDEGELLLNGEPVKMDSPQHARAMGIETVFQDLALAPELGPAENAFVGREILKKGVLGKLGVLDKAEMRKQAFDSFTGMGTDVKDLDAPVAALSGGQRQSVAVVLISHNMPEVLQAADRVEVLRLGRRVAQFEASKTNVEELVGAMTGALDKVVGS